jgi:hypothetical protein
MGVKLGSRPLKQDETSQIINEQVKLLLLLQWGETMSLWNWAANGLIFHPPDDT